MRFHKRKAIHAKLANIFEQGYFSPLFYFYSLLFFYFLSFLFLLSWEPQFILLSILSQALSTQAATRFTHEVAIALILVWKPGEYGLGKVSLSTLS